jgi:hypothetical protein
VLLTRAPLYQGRSPFSCDLHVLGAPLTFVLSQDQTLQLNLVSSQAEAWSLACDWSVASVVAIGVIAGPRALREPNSSSPSSLQTQTEGAKASVRFSFQGPRRARRPKKVGGGSLVPRYVSVKS